jgi:hypothetical protein
MMKGTYLLHSKPQMEYTDAEHDGDSYAVSLVAPVQFKMELPSAYDEIVSPVFEEIKADLGRRGLIVDPSELREWKHRSE